MSEAELLECLYRVGDDKYQGKGCAWMAWRLADVGHHVMLRPERGANLLLPQAHHEAAPASTHLYKLGKGKLHNVVKLMANCLEQKGTMRAMSRGDYDGLVAANEPPPPSPRRVLKNYGDMTTSEFQSHLIKLDTTFQGDKALNTGKRPPNTEDEFVHLQSRALCLAAPQATPGRPVANGEPAGVAPSPTSDDRLRHQREHRELLVVQPRKQPLDFFKAQARDERRSLIFYGDSGNGKTPLASCLAAMVARDVGLDKFVMVSSPDMLRSAVPPA